MADLPPRIEQALEAHDEEEQKLGAAGMSKDGQAYRAKVWLEAEIRLGMTSAALAALPEWLHGKGHRRLREMLAADTRAADEAASAYVNVRHGAPSPGAGAPTTSREER